MGRLKKRGTWLTEQRRPCASRSAQKQYQPSIAASLKHDHLTKLLSDLSPSALVRIGSCLRFAAALRVEAEFLDALARFFAVDRIWPPATRAGWIVRGRLMADADAADADGSSSSSIDSRSLLSASACCCTLSFLFSSLMLCSILLGLLEVSEWRPPPAPPQPPLRPPWRPSDRGRRRWCDHPLR